MPQLTRSLVITIISTIMMSQIMCNQSHSNELIQIPLVREVPAQYSARDFESNYEARKLAQQNSKKEIVPISQNYRQQFKGTITASLNFTSFQVIFDTTQSVTYLPKVDCIQCFDQPSFYCLDRKPFNNELTCNPSNACSLSDVFDGQEYWSSDDGYVVLGKVATTYIGNRGYTYIKQNFLLIHGTVNMTYSAQDGVFGLGLKTPSIYGGSTFVEDLYNAGEIPSPTFSFSFDPLNLDLNSALTFGGYDNSRVPDPTKITYHNVIQLSSSGSQNMYWSIAGSSISVGGLNIQLNSTAALIDSSSPNIQVPESLFQGIMIQFQTKYSAIYKSEDQSMTVDCDADLPTFSIDLLKTQNSQNSNITYSIPRSLYTQFYAVPNRCKVLISPIPKSKYPKDITVVLGTSFLIGYISIFDLANKNIGFIIPIDPTTTNSFPWTLVAILVGLGAIIVGVLFCHSRWKRNKNKSALEKQLNLNHLENASTTSV